MIHGKDELRRHVLSERDALEKSSIKTLSHAIQKKVIESSLFRSATVVGAYHAVGSEVKTDLIVSEARKQGKIICLPRVQESRISFYEFVLEDGLVKGRFGIMEPPPDARPALPEILIVPGVAFDRDGYRLGYGKGYYDRFLSESTTTSIGLAYSFQVIEKIPSSPHDKRMNALVTEKELITLGA